MNDIFSPSIDDYKSQGSAAWHEFRSKHLGASEVPSVMGSCDFGNIFEKWSEKTGLYKKEINNFATSRGIAFEPIIRDRFETLYNCKLSQDVIEYNEWPILSASLDGFYVDSDLKSIVVEIKYPSKEKHTLALSGVVPKTYVDQVQSQLLVTSADFCYYVSFNDAFSESEKIAIVKVMPDKKRQEEILKTCKMFWGLVTSNVPPVGLSVQNELSNKTSYVVEIKEKIKALSLELEDRELELKKEMRASTVISGDYTLSWSSRKGSIDYSNIRELADVDLEIYRKKESRVFSIKKNS